MSQLTTHILDTSAGKPAHGVRVTLISNGQTIAEGITNADGRIPSLLNPSILLPPGIYTLQFHIAPYYALQHVKCFYPFVHIAFEITDSSHYHVPLLLNPYGYSTYRGS